VVRFGPDGRVIAADRRDTKVRFWELAMSEVYRTIVRDPILGKAQYGIPAFSPRHRLLVTCLADGLGFWDSHTGTQVHFLSLYDPYSIVFEDSGAFLTGGPGGPFRWPVHSDPATSGLLRIGPPERIPVTVVPGRDMACSRDGSVVAAAQPRGALIWRRHHAGELLRVEHYDARRIGVSPDGRWIATGSHWGTGAKVWDAHSGVLVADLVPTQTTVGVRFSPDGKWLATTGASCHIWSVGSWQESPSPGAGMTAAFSPDGRMLALETGQNIVRLIDPATAREYASLEDPNQDRTSWMCFSPDGAQLAVIGEGKSIHLWDLRTLRTELAARRLHWDLPPYPTAEDAASNESIRVIVDSGVEGISGTPKSLRRAIAQASALLMLCPFHAESYFRRALARAELDDWPQARADCDRALALDPNLTPAYYLRGWACGHLGDDRQALNDFAAAGRHEPHRPPGLTELQSVLEAGARDPMQDNNRAWGYLTGSTAQQMPGLAVLLAERAALLAPDNATCWNTLGLALYRLGKYPSAIDKLRHSLEVSHRTAAAYDLFFLSMCHAKLGEPDKARTCYDEANAWWKAQKRLPGDWVAELTAFRAEAVEMLGMHP
jgi:Tfp pilus assembly protein PilF